MIYPRKLLRRNAGIYQIHTQLSHTPIIEQDGLIFEVVASGFCKPLKRLLLRLGMIGAHIIVYQPPDYPTNMMGLK